MTSARRFGGLAVPTAGAGRRVGWPPGGEMSPC